MVTVVEKEPKLTDSSFDSVDALEELEGIDAIPEFTREDESNAHHLPAQPRQPGPLAAATAATTAALRSAQSITGPRPAQAPPAPVLAPAPVYAAAPAPAYEPAPVHAPRPQHTLQSPLLDRHPGADRNPGVSTGDGTPRSDELETLWPGVVHHEMGIIQGAAKRTPSFFIMIGFMAGAVFSLLSVWGYSAVSTHLAKGGDDSSKQIVVAKGQDSAPEHNFVAQASDPNAEIVPISSSYEVKSGDTLVVIAMKNYKKVTPRLIDLIVKANGLKSANALKLGQSLKLPHYRNQSSKLASRAAARAEAARRVN